MNADVSHGILIGLIVGYLIGMSPIFLVWFERKIWKTK